MLGYMPIYINIDTFLSCVNTVYTFVPLSVHKKQISLTKAIVMNTPMNWFRKVGFANRRKKL